MHGWMDEDAHTDECKDGHTGYTEVKRLKKRGLSRRATANVFYLLELVLIIFKKWYDYVCVVFVVLAQRGVI